MPRGFRFDNSYHQLPDALFMEQSPLPVSAPELLQLNVPLAEALGLDVAQLQAQGADWFSGNQLIPGSQPLSQAYAGHQFGQPTMLGDGRAVLLGEHLTPLGKRYDIQLKGAGRTPFSRGGDGRAVLGPMLREYLVSEAMAALGVPTSRSLAVVTSGEKVQRERPMPGAILTRVAASHIRVGTFQYAAWHDDKRLLKQLFDYTVERHYPQVKEADNPALALLEAVMDKQIALVIHWLRVGFIHGVMNTDNVMISGETLDYGPCAFMDTYHPATVFSSIDRQGRYAFAAQPGITQWNLSRFAESLLTLIDEDEDRAIELASDLLEGCMPRFGKAFHRMMKDKLGLTADKPGDEQLVKDWLALLQQQKMDYTNAHRALMAPHLPDETAYHTEAFTAWYERWHPRNRRSLGLSRKMMKAANPAVIPRNHLVNQALEAAEAGDMMPFKTLLRVLETPYQQPEDERFTRLPAPGEEVKYTFCGT